VAGTGENVNSKSLKEMVKETLLTNPFTSFVTTLECYRVGKVLGKGAFGKVNLALHKLTKKFVAIKSINK
jgi:serine/threonine protein kinase